MTETRERILMTALHLFARDGYEAVSVSAIAGELGMTKGALYKHYRNKRDIFDSIVDRMYQIDAQRARDYDVPGVKYEADPTAYRSLPIGRIREYTLAQLAFWTEDCFAADFRRMLSLERYRNAEMAELYRSCLTSGPVAYMADTFREMMAGGILSKSEPELLAVEFYAPLYLMISAEDRAQFAGLLDRHIECFFRQNAAEDWKKEDFK